jgi:predicted lipoprotein with Yx(FWY)xxD motif
LPTTPSSARCERRCGLTLYRFDKDTAEPPKSNCDGDCATAWPPVPADDATAGAGIDKSLLGEVTRTDGTKQLTSAAGPPTATPRTPTPVTSTARVWAASGTRSPPTARRPRPAPAAARPVRRRKDPKLGDIVVDKNGHDGLPLPQGQGVAEVGLELRRRLPGEVAGRRHRSANDTKGVEKKGLMGFTRSDGAKQMTVDCWPIYTFSGDKAPDDTNGQGVGGTWYAVSPEGKPVGAPAK